MIQNISIIWMHTTKHMQLMSLVHKIPFGREIYIIL